MPELLTPGEHFNAAISHMDIRCQWFLRGVYDTMHNEADATAANAESEQAHDFYVEGTHAIGMFVSLLAARGGE